MTFASLWSLYIPGTLLFTPCGITGEPSAVRLLSCSLYTCGNTSYWSLCVEGHDVQSGKEQIFQNMISINSYEGVKQVTDLDAYPLSLHPKYDETRQFLIRRGRKWRKFTPHPFCHLQYEGIAFHYNNYSYRKIGVS